MIWTTWKAFAQPATTKHIRKKEERDKNDPPSFENEKIKPLGPVGGAFSKYA